MNRGGEVWANARRARVKNFQTNGAFWRMLLFMNHQKKSGYHHPFFRAKVVILTRVRFPSPAPLIIKDLRSSAVKTQADSPERDSFENTFALSAQVGAWPSEAKSRSAASRRVTVSG